uniref:Uncharacterized protein n=1 Tax=Anguilla anguilla TaxID=7936 RepID=A0A0E9SQ90_ANGAN
MSTLRFYELVVGEFLIRHMCGLTCCVCGLSVFRCGLEKCGFILGFLSGRLHLWHFVSSRVMIMDSFALVL